MSIKHCHHPTLISLLNEVAAKHDLDPKMLKGLYRGCHVVAARREFCRRAFALQIFSTPEIGGAINKDHTTVLHHCGLLKRTKRKAA